MANIESITANLASLKTQTSNSFERKTNIGFDWYQINITYTDKVFFDKKKRQLEIISFDQNSEMVIETFSTKGMDVSFGNDTYPLMSYSIINFDQNKYGAVEVTSELGITKISLRKGKKGKFSI
jgi:hypothetical protein